MTTRPTNATFKGAVRKLWNSLRARHRGGNAVKYGPIGMGRDEFEAWLWGKSTEGLTWKCEYTGNILQLFAKTQAGRLTIDHKVPLAQGGTSTLDNLAVCSEEANQIKRDLSEDRYNSLMYFLKGWPESDRKSVLIRLQLYKPKWGKRGR